MHLFVLLLNMSALNKQTSAYRPFCQALHRPPRGEVESPSLQVYKCIDMYNTCVDVAFTDMG